MVARTKVAETPTLLLASASPRRQQLLTQIGVCFTVLPVEIDESVQQGELPEHYVTRLAKNKALTGLARHSAKLPVLGADTAVVLDDRILGKPRDREDALMMLMMLSGRTHRVLSGVALASAERCEYRLAETKVTFRLLKRMECEYYWETGEPLDKAGAYGIQGKGAVFVESIRGSYSCVVGLPLVETCELLDAFTIPWWGSANNTDVKV